MTALSFITVTELAALARKLLQLDELAREVAAASAKSPAPMIDELQQQADLARELYLSLTRAAMDLVGKQVPPPLSDTHRQNVTDTLAENLARMVSAQIGIDVRPRPAVIEVTHVVLLIKQAEHTLRMLQRRVESVAKASLTLCCVVTVSARENSPICQH